MVSNLRMIIRYALNHVTRPAQPSPMILTLESPFEKEIIAIEARICDETRFEYACFSNSTSPCGDGPRQLHGRKESKRAKSEKNHPNCDPIT
jgi:hypothetical protein